MDRMREFLQYLIDNHLTLGSVESVTGGRFADEICRYPGVSAVFKGGIVAYTPETKAALVGVTPELIAKHGIISEEVARQMAIGGKAALGVDVCLSCTGNAGPSVQDGGAAIGDAYMSCAYKGNVWTIGLRFGDKGRDGVRSAVVNGMIELGCSVFETHDISA